MRETHTPFQFISIDQPTTKSLHNHKTTISARHDTTNASSDTENALQESSQMKSLVASREGRLIPSPSPTDANDSDLCTSSSSSLDGSSTTMADDEAEDSNSLSSSVGSTTYMRRAPQSSGRWRKLLRRQSSLQEASMHLTAGTVASIVVVIFSLFFPFLFTPTAAKETYIFAFWQYDPSISHFDNTAWTSTCSTARPRACCCWEFRFKPSILPCARQDGVPAVCWPATCSP